jgi:hypothetical protein
VGTLDGMAKEVESYEVLARRVRERIGGAGRTDRGLRVSAMNRAAGGPAIAQPYDALADQIGQAAYLVTDAQVAAVRDAVGADKGAFEIVVAASIGAGLLRWDAALHAIEGATDATA